MARVADDTGTTKPVKSELVKSIIRKQHRKPITYYKLKDMAIDLTSNPNFLDAILLSIGFIAMITAFPFYPIIVAVILLALIFAAVLRHPFLGLVVFLVMIFPPIAYQMPALAWIFMIVISASLIFGYMHYRVLALIYAIISLAFSFLGYFFVIPLFIAAVLIVGAKRAIALSAIFLLSVVMLSGVSGMQNTGYIMYNSKPAYAAISNTPYAAYLTPNKPTLSLTNFLSGASEGMKKWVSADTINAVPIAFGYLLSSLTFQPTQYMAELAGLMLTAIAIDMLAVGMKSRLRGMYSSLAGVGYPLLYILMSYAWGMRFSYLTPLVSFLLAPAALYVLGLYNIDIVKALDVRKQDIRMRFGEAFEDLQSESFSGSFSDIGDYEATKKELHDAVIAPIEERGISRAYNVKPAKGILLFGPPGTGKTMLMRALANDIKAGFYLVKASNLISPFPGDTERKISDVFSIAKKNAPCVLFFDEIDAVSKSREMETDETHRQGLSQLLVEIDGFQKLNSVVVVGATNAPQLIDPALIRPGRFDRIIYMPLPDFNGRKAIFKIYLNKLPVSKKVDLDELAEKTERYSGADIKAITDSVAQSMAQEAVGQHKVLEITQEDLLDGIRAHKPSTTLAQLEDYNRFRIDFERRTYKDGSTEVSEQIGMDDVIGLEEAKKAVVEAVQIPLMHPDLIKRYDIKPINGLLLFGPPGTGKSMLMRAVGNEMKGVTILEIKGSDLADSGRQEAITLIKETFDRARENVPAIIFIDEVDTIIPKREGLERGTQVTGEMLEEIDGIRKFSGIVVIAATNRPDALHPAILRAGRFDKMIFIKPPTANERADLFRMYLKNIPVSSDFDFNELGGDSEGFTGADIANICREAKTRALAENIRTGQEIKISQANIESILQNIRPSAPSIVVSSYLTFLARYGQR